jgi:serine/threonine protein kinase
MGYVYRAEDLELGRKVALKVLAPELARDDEFRSRFVQESRNAARLEHPSIIPIYEAGEGDGLLYISMRFVDGPDLGAVLDREGRMHAGRVVNLLDQIGEALDSATATASSTVT